MLVMRFLTNKQVFKTPSWYFGEKALKNIEKWRGKNVPHFFFLKQTQ